MSYRDDVAALAARHVSLESELAAKTRELDAATRLLDEAKEKARLPVLPNLHIASPCPADWNAMTGDERVRMCGSCNKHVFNLSSMTRADAEDLVIEKHGNLCVRYFQRKDGTILLKDCTIGASAARKRKLIAAGTAALLAGGAFAAWAQRRHGDEPGAANVYVPTPPAELTVRDQQLARESEPPPAPPVPTVLQLDEHQWHATGGAVMIMNNDVELK